jgi:hypothetical protein
VVHRSGKEANARCRHRLHLGILADLDAASIRKDDLDAACGGAHAIAWHERHVPGRRFRDAVSVERRFTGDGCEIRRRRGLLRAYGGGSCHRDCRDETDLSKEGVHEGLGRHEPSKRQQG